MTPSIPVTPTRVKEAVSKLVKQSIPVASTWVEETVS
jgi:hypothetical protein